jgi:phage tail P2-like protein
MPDHLLPNNASKAEQAMSMAVSRLSDVPLAVRESWSPDTCPSHLLPWLAWAFSVDKWDTGWSDEQKRGAIRASVFVHRHKGTLGGVIAALDAVGYANVLTEWFNMVPQGDPYTFGVDITVADFGIPTAAAFDNIVSIINASKNVRSHLASFTVRSTRRGNIYAAGVALCGETVFIREYVDPLQFSDLLTEALANGYEQTEAAVLALHAHINTTLSSANYW